MAIDLEPAKAILRSFLSEIDKVKAILQSFSEPRMASAFSVEDQQPIFDSTEFCPSSNSYWEKENAYMLLYAEAWHFRALMHRPKPNVIPEYYQQPALPLYQQWRQGEREVFHRRCVQIHKPAAEMNLAYYLQDLASTASEGNERRDVWIESLLCFLDFLRKDMTLDQKGYLETLFPSQESCKGMEFRRGYSFEKRGTKIRKVKRQYLLRRLEKTTSSINIFAASEIIKNLIHTVLEGRSDVQRSAAEALGFTWLCHAVGCYRLTTRESLVFDVELNTFRPPNQTNPKEWLFPTHFIGIPSLFGVIDVPVSRALYEFLLALPRDPTNNRIFTNLNFGFIL